MKTEYGRMKVKFTHCDSKTLVTLLLAVGTMVPMGLEFPQQSHAGRKKRRELSTSQGKDLSSIKGPHTALTFQTEGYWTQDNDGSVVGRTTL